MTTTESSQQEKINLLDLDAEGIRAWCASIGQKPFRATQLARWIHRYCCDDFDAMTNLAKEFRARLKDLAYIKAPSIIREHKSADGTQGFNRNLTTGEIVGQLWTAERELRREAGITDPNDRVISNVVLMGMGEPLQNLDNVIPALRIFLDDNGYGLSRRRVTVSTSGLVRQMDKLGEAVPVALAVSLHAPDDALRDKLMPVNKKHPLEELLAACRRYLKVAPRDFITFEYLLLGGINDAPEQARALVKLVKTVPCKFNLIPFNPFPDSDLKQPEREKVLAFAKILNDAGIVTTVRKTRGDDIAAACGQLAGEVRDRTRRAIRLVQQKEEARDLLVKDAAASH